MYQLIVIIIINIIIIRRLFILHNLLRKLKQHFFKSLTPKLCIMSINFTSGCVLLTNFDHLSTLSGLYEHKSLKIT